MEAEVKRYMELEEVAEFLKLSTGTLRQWLKKGITTNRFRNYTFKVGRRVCITHENLERWMNGLEPVGTSRFPPQGE